MGMVSKLFLTLGGAPELGNGVTQCFLIVATILFCIVVLNLFIAVHGEAYDQAQEKAGTSFLQERASICLQCLLRPSWPPRCCAQHRVSHRTALYILLTLIDISVWVALLRQDLVIVATIQLFLCKVVEDSLLVQRPWDKTEEQHYYLWICYREDFNANTLIPVQKPNLEGAMNGRLANLKRDNNLQHERLTDDLRRIKAQVEGRTHGLTQRVGQVESRLEELVDGLRDVLGDTGCPEVDSPGDTAGLGSSIGTREQVTSPKFRRLKDTRSTTPQSYPMRPSQQSQSVQSHRRQHKPEVLKLE